MRIKLLLIMVPLGMLALALAGGFILMLHLFALSVLVLLLSYFWTRLGIRGIVVQVNRSAEHGQVGEWFIEEITVLNESKVPKLLIEVEEITDLPGHRNMAAFNLSSQGSHSWQTRVHCQRRGQYSLGALTATVTDPFGFFSLQRKLGEPQEIIVYPATLELPYFEPLSRQVLELGLGGWLVSEVGPNAARVREYASSDSLNRIHWHTTAHTGKLMVKEFEPDRSNYAVKRVWIILDMHQASQLEDDDSATEEYGITIAASVAKKYIDSGKRVGLIAAGDQSYLFPPHMGSQHLQQMLEALSFMKASGEVPIDNLLSSEAERFGIDSAVIAITPAAIEQTIASLRHLRRRCATVVAILLDPVSFGGTTSAVKAAHSLIASGIHVYVIRRGDELVRALDSRTLIPRMRYMGVAV